MQRTEGWSHLWNHLDKGCIDSSNLGLDLRRILIDHKTRAFVICVEAAGLLLATTLEKIEARNSYQFKISLGLTIPNAMIELEKLTDRRITRLKYYWDQCKTVFSS